MIVDVSLNPVLGDEELKVRMGEPWRSGRIPSLLGTRHQAPFDEVAVPLEEAGDPAAVSRVLADRGVDLAVVTPLSRGLMPNPQHAAAIVRATNEWVAEEWLPAGDGKFVASLRVPLTDVAASLAEIERYAGDERFVQLAVPLRAYLPFGDDFYFPIWSAAAELGLPVCVLDDYSTVVEHPETPVGMVRYFSEKHALRPFAGIVQLSSMITSGLFDRLPELRVIVGDGGLDLSRPMFWRIDRDWRQSRVEIPWVERPPSDYLPDHVRFVTQPEDGLTDGVQLEEDLLRITRAEQLLLFGSHYPYWDNQDARTALGGWDEGIRKRVFSENALEWIPRLRAHAQAQAPARAGADEAGR
jgi:predicted TIM-barrel fold metal-dependent hydrolase